MTFWGRKTGLAAAVLATACLNDPGAPAAYRLEVRPDTIRFAALRDTVRPLILEHHGSVGPSPLFVGTYEILDTRIAIASTTGLISSRGAGTTRLVVRSPHGASDTAVVLVSQAVAHVRVQQDTLTLEALEAVLPIPVVAEDPLGSEIQDAALVYEVADTTVASVTETGLVRARANGITSLTVLAGGQSATIVVRVAQRVSRIAGAPDTLQFTSLGQMQTISAQPLDSLGHPVANAEYRVTISDTTVLQLVDSLTVRSKSYGASTVQVDAGGRTATQLGLVSRVPSQVEAALTDTAAILSLVLGSAIPVSCRVLDGDGATMPIDPQVLPSSTGRWSGSTCSTLTVRASGIDTVQIVAGTVTTALPIALAVRPIVSNVRTLPLDSMPAESGPWAPTLRRNSRGQLEVYATGYVSDSMYGGFRGHLHRYLSQDGKNFAYDGVAVSRDDSLCSLNGSGIENIAIVPRADGPGWRMLYAGGGFACYGWQVFSAVSTDERTWTKEPGIRIGNGLPLDQPTGDAPWPAGEGMVVDQLPTGEWRMIGSTYEPVPNSDQKWQITEWRSWDQLRWTYVRTVFSTRQLPPEGQRSVYSPTVREIAPGLWRMIVTADDLNIPGGRSRLWSAVSTDEETWQLEGELLGEVGGDYLYSSLLDDQLVFLQQTAGLPRVIGIATVQMP